MQETSSVAFNALLWALLAGSAGAWVAIVRRLLRREPLAPYEPHPIVPWTGWDVLMLVSVLLLLLAALGDSAHGIDVNPPPVSPKSVAMGSAAQLIWLLFAIAFLSARAGANIDDLGFDMRKLGSDIRLGLMSFLAVVLPVYGLQAVLTQWMPSEHPLQKLTKEQPEFVALAILAAVVVGPICEEFAFRVLLQGWLEKSLALIQSGENTSAPDRSGFLAIVAVSIIFGVMHWGHGPDPIPLFVLSLFLGYVYQRTHRIFPSLVVHVCVNALAMLDLLVTLP
jgi:membrane protease YdiL (CAAX protease family)